VDGTTQMEIDKKKKNTCFQSSSFQSSSFSPFCKRLIGPHIFLSILELSSFLPIIVNCGLAASKIFERLNLLASFLKLWCFLPEGGFADQYLVDPSQNLGASSSLLVLEVKIFLCSPTSTAPTSNYPPFFFSLPQ
jgi:hypothetical protein